MAASVQNMCKLFFHYYFFPGTARCLSYAIYTALSIRDHVGMARGIQEDVCTVCTGMIAAIQGMGVSKDLVLINTPRTHSVWIPKDGCIFVQIYMYTCTLHIHTCRCMHIYIMHTCAPHLFCFFGENRLIQLSFNINPLLPLSRKKQVECVPVLPSVLDTCLKGGVLQGGGPLPTLGRS